MMNQACSSSSGVVVELSSEDRFEDPRTNK